MSEQFYDKVVRKFGVYGGTHPHLTEYPQGNPEELFEQKLVELSSKEKVALDLGCGDGRFTLRLAQYFQEMVGIDGSIEQLKLARAEQQGHSHVRFEEQDASHTTFPDQTFDLIYSRRGPGAYQECFRITKPGGNFAMISIGEKDALDLKKIFGRGQGYEHRNTSALEWAQAELQRAGFTIIYGREVSYDEYYASLDSLDRFLQGVPIFENFDSEKDRSLLATYAARFQTAQGIRLPRHR